jgi:hypothetical protein
VDRIATVRPQTLSRAILAWVTGGRLALFEVIAEDSAELHYPVPWADCPAESFVIPPEQWLGILADAGFEPLRWLIGKDVQAVLAAAAAAGPAMAPGVPGIGLELLLPDYEARMAGLARNVEEQRITMLMAIVEAR